MGDYQNGFVGAAHFVDAIRDDPQGVDVEAGIGFIQYDEGWIEKCHLQDFGAFLFAA